MTWNSMWHFCLPFLVGANLWSWHGPNAAAASKWLLSAAELARQLESDSIPLDVLDVRSEQDYQAGHVPTARWLDTTPWREKTLSETGLTDRDYWSDQLAQTGLSSTRPIVIVGDSWPEASRIAWLLRYLGLEQVRLVDGGHAAWVSADKPLSNEPAAAIHVTSEVEIRFQPDRLATLLDLAQPVGTEPQIQIIDNRSRAEYTGQRGVGTRTGHIPGAKHLEWSRFIDQSTGQMLSVEAIGALLDSEGIDIDRPLVMHCQTGGRSSVVAIALELAGAKEVKNYYRGWSEYAGALTHPVEKSE